MNGFNRAATAAVFAGAASLLLLLSAGCGSGSMNTLSPAAMTSSTQIRMGDAPSARVVSFEVTVGPISLTSSDGSSVTVLSARRRLEVTHLAGTSEPLTVLNVPQGSYASATITLSNPEVVFLNSSGQLANLEPVMNQVVTVTFSPPLVITSTASVLTLDLNVAGSLSFDGQGNVTAIAFGASSFSVGISAVMSENEQEAENGELEDITGMVTSVSGSSFMLNVGQSAAALTFTTDANTQFNDGASLATLLNTIVRVEGVTRANGTLYAKEGEGVEANTGAELEGLVTQTSGSPATQVTILVQDGSGSGMDAAKIGATVTLNVGSARFAVTQGNIDTSGIGGLPSAPNFPFGASSLHAGQRIELETAEGMGGNLTTAEKVNLKQQALTGTVSGLGASAPPARFTLALPADSAFAMLSGSNTVTVFWQPGTDVHDLPAGFHNGDPIRVRGLVFFTGTGFNMIARRITP